MISCYATRIARLCTVFLLALILPLSAAPESCISPDAYATGLSKRFPNEYAHISVDVMLTDVQAQRFLTSFNAILPITDFVADHIIVYRHGARSPRLVVLFQKSCLVKDNFLTPKLYERIMRQAGLDVPQHI